MKLRGKTAVTAVAAMAAFVLAAPGSPARAAAGAWSVVPAPNPDVQFTYLTGVDAVSDADAWAVGYVQPPGVGPYQPLALHWNGAAWSTVAMPQQGTNGTTLYGVSAAGTADAWAVGNVFTRSGYGVTSVPAALHWNGSTWSPSTVPGSGVLFGVTDLGPANAYAVGDALKHWDGATWVNVTTPSPNPSGVGAGNLTAVSARTPADIWAVGTFSPRRHVTSGFSLHFDGSTWTLQPMPAGTQPWAVVAVGPNDAWAVGQITGLTTQPLTEHWDGTSWTVVPNPTLPNGGYLRSVTARAGNDVWAVGPAFTGSGVRPLLLHWDGAHWAGTAAPALTDADVWAVTARPGTSHTWATGTQTLVGPGAPLILERH